MSARNVGAAVVIDPDEQGPGVITERDILHSLGNGDDPDREQVAGHLTSHLTFAAPDWSLEQAAAAMVRGEFRHLVVVTAASCWACSRCATSFAAGPRRARRATFRRRRGRSRPRASGEA